MNHIFSTVMVTVIKLLYGICIVILAVYGFNSLGLAIMYLLTLRQKSNQKPAEKKQGPLPFVTVQLPVYNESTMLERLVKAVANQQYPHDRYEIQILDDSTDETTQLAARWVEAYRSKGWNIRLIHRDDRTGYKAGALAHGLECAQGEFLAIFDADFIPGPDWLPTIMAGFDDDPEIGCVQSRWSHLNSRYNLLTNAEALALDAHFMVEQNARYRNGLFLGFNGSGGVWRKKAIIDAGGWQSDTLTEDLDLSYRAQLKGWKIVYLPNITVPGELPAQMDAFKNQQYRWAKGSAQTLRKLAWEVLRSKQPWYKRLMGVMHLSMYMPFPFMVGALLLTLPVALYASGTMNKYWWTVFAGLGPPILYTVARTSHMPHFRDRFVRMPALLLIGMGISLNSAFAVVSGIFTKGGVFIRTPKFNIRGKQGQWANHPYALPTNPVVYGELFLAFYALFTVLVLWKTDIGKAIAPGMIYYSISYMFMASMSFIQSYQMHRVRSRIV